MIAILCGFGCISFQHYKTLKDLGYQLPNIDISKVNSLKTERNRYHYYILGDLSMYDYFGLKSFFEYVPLVLQTINEGLRILNTLRGERLDINNRFDDILNNIGVIYKNCGEDASFLSSFK